MANRDTPNGLKPIKHLNGSPWNGSLNRYAIPAADGTATFKGDLVKHYGTNDVNGIPQVIQAAAADAVLIGVIVDFEPDPTNLESKYRLANTLRYCWVCDDPTVIFEIQEDSVGGSIALADMGKNADVVVGAGDTNTGASGMELDSSDVKAATAQLRILRVVQRDDNTPVSANCRFEVLINEHSLKMEVGI